MSDDKKPRAGAPVRSQKVRSKPARSPSVRSLGLDFGTTNSVAAINRPDGSVATATFTHAGVSEATCRSALGFSRQPGAGETRIEVGPWAVERYLADPMDCRFLQSFKTFAASASFRSTIIHGRTYRYEDLMAAFLERMLAQADTPLEPETRRLVIGRPVAYAGHAPDPRLAEERYGAALAKCGIDEVHYVYEPVAAAFYYAQRLTRDATVLVADFGGGTSDFSIIRFALGRDGLKAVPLAKTGVGLAGDRFDYRIIDHVVSPKLGKGSRYKSFDKMLDFPSHYFANFAAWHQLAIMKSSQTLRELRQLARVSDTPEQLEMLITIIEEDLGYALYKAVSEAKFMLSREPVAELRFASGVFGGVHVFTPSADVPDDWSLRLVVLPQALRISIPPFVNLAIAVLQDTTLVTVIGLFDFLNTSRAATTDPNWLGFYDEAYVLVATVYFIACFAGSRYSLALERRLARG
jgi:hypothetical chaperone protein